MRCSIAVTLFTWPGANNGFSLKESSGNSEGFRSKNRRPVSPYSPWRHIYTSCFVTVWLLVFAFNRVDSALVRTITWYLRTKTKFLKSSCTRGIKPKRVTRDRGLSSRLTTWATQLRTTKKHRTGSKPLASLSSIWPTLGLNSRLPVTIAISLPLRQPADVKNLKSCMRNKFFTRLLRERKINQQLTKKCIELGNTGFPSADMTGNSRNVDPSSLDRASHRLNLNRYISLVFIFFILT